MHILRYCIVTVNQVNIVYALAILRRGAFAVVETHECAASIRKNNFACFLCTGCSEEGEQLNSADLSSTELSKAFVRNAHAYTVICQLPIQSDREGEGFSSVSFIFRYPERLHLFIVFHSESSVAGILVHLLLVAAGDTL